jgi:ketosteroid isomerase-like protein
MILAILAASGMLASSANDPRALVDQLFTAFNRHDALALQSLYTPEAVLTSSDFCLPRTGRDVARTYTAMFLAFPDIQDTIVTVIVDGDRAAVRFAATGKIKGKAFRMKLMTMLRFKDGHIVEDDTVFDNGGRPCER